MIQLIHRVASFFFNILLLFLFFSSSGAGQDYRWLNVGDFHNFYSSVGSEREEGFINEQQAGWQWPAIYRSQDAQAAKGLWLGAINNTDDRGVTRAVRVIHVGPRANGLVSFFPLEMTTTSKFAPPSVFVDGVEALSKPVINDVIDPNLKADRQIYTKMNSLLGVTVERTISQFSQEFHDDYHILEYVFTNTGNTDADEEIELPNQTLEDFVIFFQNRMAPVQAVRFVIGNNPVGWGFNTMNDRRGDGQIGGEPETFRAQFAWHGKYPPFTDYDNIGGPIWVPNTLRGYLEPTDTTGRLGAYHFVGTVTLHADASSTNDSDDPNQPFTMTEVGSDDADVNFQNDPFDTGQMADEYNLMTSGREKTRHAYIVEPTGLPGFIEPTNDPSLNTSGGWSYAYGYGPYILAPGESVRIVIAEGSSGISRELAEETGIAFKAGAITAKEKNEVVFQGRDSLFQMFDKAISNYNSDFNIPSAPAPPSSFFVNSLGGGVEIDWEYTGNEADIESFEIYRAETRVDSTYRLVYRAEPVERFFKDGDEERELSPGKFFAPTPTRGRDYYYYITAVGAVNNDNTGLTPVGTKLRSNRHYTQTYLPARLLREPGEAMSQIRVVPNPYNPNVDANLQLDPTFGIDRISFYEVPGKCRIEIYTELGELVRTIVHDKLSGDVDWDLRTDSRQRVVSGVYIARIVNEDENDDEFGAVAIRKIVIIL